MLRRRESSRSATASPAGAASALATTAAPSSAPAATARLLDGSWVYPNETATAPTANASAGPSDAIPAVVQMTEPLVVTSSAATRAPKRDVMRRPAA